MRAIATHARKKEQMQHPAKRVLLWIGLVSMLTGMAGCAVMDKSECTNANWHEIGKADGLAGGSLFSARQESCAKHGLGADKPAYDRGLQTGLAGFCTAASGRAHGAKGGSYQRGVCPVHTESDFLSGYTPAYEKFKFQKKIRELQAQISEKEDLLGKELGNPVKSKQNIESLRGQIKRLNKELQTEMYMRLLD